MPLYLSPPKRQEQTQTHTRDTTGLHPIPQRYSRDFTKKEQHLSLPRTESPFARFLATCFQAEEFWIEMSMADQFQFFQEFEGEQLEMSRYFLIRELETEDGHTEFRTLNTTVNGPRGLSDQAFEERALPAIWKNLEEIFHCASSVWPYSHNIEGFAQWADEYREQLSTFSEEGLTLWRKHRTDEKNLRWFFAADFNKYANAYVDCTTY